MDWTTEKTLAEVKNKPNNYKYKPFTDAHYSKIKIILSDKSPITSKKVLSVNYGIDKALQILTLAILTQCVLFFIHFYNV